MTESNPLTLDSGPPLIQPHGVLLAARASDGVVTHASANAQQLLGRGKDEILGQTVADILDETARTLFEDCAREDARGPVNGWQLPARTYDGHRYFDVTAHRAGEHVILELENPTTVPESHHSLQRAIHPFFHFACSGFTVSADANAIRTTCESVCAEMRGLTGFDRVMVYRFAPFSEGEVVAEAYAAGLESRLGLKYPAVEVPVQNPARPGSWVRLIVDVAAEPAPLDAASPTGLPLDLSQCVLREVTPRLREFLENYQVGAAFVVSLMRGDELWGLIACHHREPRHVSAEIRVACAMLGVLASAHLSACEAAVEARQNVTLREIYARLIYVLGSTASVSEGLLAAKDDLLQLVRAGGAAILFGTDVHLIGNTPDEIEVHRIKAWLDENQTEPFLSTSSLADGWEDAADFAGSASGLISLRLWPEDYLLFFRPMTASPEMKSGDQLASQASARSEPWRRSELNTARDLQNAIDGFIQQRNEELSHLSREVQDRRKEIDELVYSVSHDLKSPLVTCQGFIGLMLEDLKTGDTEAVLDSASRIQRAATQMGDLIDDLLKHSRMGRRDVDREDIDVQQLLARMKENLAERLSEAGATLVIASGLPAVHASPVDLERIFENLISNALKYATVDPDTDIGLRIEIGGASDRLGARLFVRDNGPGIEPDYHETIFRLFQRLDKTKPGSGVGLASVAKIMNAYGGRAWVDSAPGEGATFWIAFPQPNTRPKVFQVS
ncbi:MAG: chemotaxis family two-component system sensor kinase Cph1 [Verrucomicrobiales bacterium]|jgi:chemotaxis family two-component system sensor kinase Cph1